MRDEEQTREVLLDELQKLRKRISDMGGGRIDDVTGLYTRAQFFELAEHEFARARRYDRPLSVIMLEIDKFSNLVSRYDEPIINDILAKIAEKCNVSVRKVDIMGRYNEGVFALLLPEADIPPAKQIAERLRKEISKKPIQTGSESIYITISLGIATLSDSIENLSGLISLADAGMLKAKNLGGNRVAIER